MDIRDQVRAAITELAAENKKFNPVHLLAVGCSSSEIAGGVIGHASAYELGEQVAEEILAVAGEMGFECAFQCCEHLNRALVMERETAEKRGYEIVCVVPQPKAGGSLATAAYRALRDPVVVQEVSAEHRGAYVFTKETLAAPEETPETATDDIIAENPVGGINDYADSK